MADVLALPQSVTIRPAKRAASVISERGQARLIRQKLLEDEQEWEDRMALGMTSVRVSPTTFMCAESIWHVERVS